MKKIKIAAIAPTAYQHSSLTKFGMPISKNGNGSFSAELEFSDIEEAREYLKERAEMYYNEKSEEENKKDIDWNLSDWGLTIDACTAIIEEIESEE